MVTFELIILGSLIFTASVQAFPESLSITVEDDNEIFTLNWKYTQQYLANKNLPVWYAWKDMQPVLQPHVMNGIGPFAMYHDVEKSSAVVYFKKINCIFGIIDTRFLIYDLPLSGCLSSTHHIVDGPYIKRRVGTNHDDLMTFIYDSISPSSSSLPPCSSHAVQDSQNHINPKHHSKLDILYPEILVFIPNRIVKKSKTAMALVAFWLVQMNAIDMLFAKLAENDILIHINIAGLVFEGEPDVFPHVYLSESSRRSKITDGIATLEGFPTYLKKYDNIFVEDSFDFYLLLTQYDIEFEGHYVDGLTRMDVNVYELRSTNNGLMDNYDLAGALIRDQQNHGNFVATAHELAHLMKVDHDPIGAGKHCFNIQCYAILQTTSSYCKNCIVWSAKSRREFRSYVRWNKNHCFLMNQPRSLHPYGVPIKTIGPHQQCVCYGYQSHWSFTHELDVVSRHACKKKLACAIGNRQIHRRNPKPVDGTPCGRGKVCWNRTCQSVIKTVRMQRNYQIGKGE